MIADILLNQSLKTMPTIVESSGQTEIQQVEPHIPARKVQNLFITSNQSVANEVTNLTEEDHNF